MSDQPLSDSEIILYQTEDGRTVELSGEFPVTVTKLSLKQGLVRA